MYIAPVRSVYVASAFGGIGRGVDPGLVSGFVHIRVARMTRLGSGFHQFRTTRNDRQKRKPVWEGGDPARQDTKAEQRLSGQAAYFCRKK